MKKSALFVLILLYSVSSSFSQWKRATGVGDRFVYSVRKMGNYLFAATDSGAYRSADGINWQMKITGLDATNLNTRDFYKTGNTIYAACFKGVYASVDNGESWQRTNYPQSTPAISIFALNNIVLASTTGGGLYRSADAGSSWLPVIGANFWKYVMVNGKLFASSFQDVLVSADTGRSWQSANFNDWAYDLLNINDTLLVSTYSNSIAQSPANTISWTYINALQIDSVAEFACRSDTVFGCTANAVFYFKNKHNPVQMLSSSGLDIFPGNKLTSIELFNNLLLVGTQSTTSLKGKGLWYYKLQRDGITSGDPIKIYPNPVVNFITVEINDSNIVQLDIFNAAGQLMYTTTNITPVMHINSKTWAKGIYFLTGRTKNGTAVFTKKLMK